MSDPVAQPLSLYVDITVPLIEFTGEEIVASPLETHAEVKVTEIGTVAGDPPMYTGTLTLLVPYAEIDEDPKVIVPRVTDTALTFIPIGVLVTVMVSFPDVNWADAVMYVAPAESILAAPTEIVATPEVFVRAVAEEGVKATSELVDAKVTTAPLTTVALASLSVAVAVMGVPNVTVVDESVKVRVGVPVVVPPPVSPPVSAVSALPPQAIRQQNRNKEKSRHIGRNFFARITLIIITLLFYQGSMMFFYNV
jgi:hypothetical protein